MTTIQLHDGASKPDFWRTKGRSKAHLRKGEIGGSVTGYLCVCMALIVLGVTSRAHIRSAYAVPDGKLQGFFAAGLDSAFGLDAQGMEELLKTVSRFVRPLRLRGKRDWLLESAVSRMGSGEICLVALGDSSFRYHEWFLAVAVESRTDTIEPGPTALLVLDPAAPIGKIEAWNGRLDLSDKPDDTYLYFTAEDGAIRKVCLKAVFSLRKRQLWET
jgi:hypothetical protein